MAGFLDKSMAKPRAPDTMNTTIKVLRVFQRHEGIGGH